MRTLNPEVHARQRTRILDTACSLFARYGFAGTSLDRIAAACRMKKPSLYHYFRNKQTLLRELVQSHFHRLHESADAPAAVAGSLEHFLLAMAQEFLARFRDRRRRDFFQLVIRDSFSDPFVRRIYMESLRERIARMCHWVRPLRPAGVSPDDFAMAMHQFMGSLVRYALETRIFRSGLGVSFAEHAYLQGLARVFARGLERSRS